MYVCLYMYIYFLRYYYTTCTFLSPSSSLSRGYIYHTVNIDNGWLVQCDGLLLYHKKSFDEGNSTNYTV